MIDRKMRWILSKLYIVYINFENYNEYYRQFGTGGEGSMKHYGLPEAQGLYRPEFEHDACGIGFYAHLKGKPSHDIIKKALHMLRQLEHRGGQGSDPETGDGAGIMTQIPHEYFQAVCGGMNLPEKRALRGRDVLFAGRGSETGVL
ncbi:hypothetical protein DI43_06160 [Geobacillus sp. CAMR12739]|nr:hypothetical protein DI43_06160 [Geobacillus sp. CAMR12739]